MGNSGWAASVVEDTYAKSWAHVGVDSVEDDSAWRVSQGTGRQVAVAANQAAFAAGILSEDLGTLTANLPTPTAGRWYLIVRHIDWQSKTVTVLAIAHTTTTTASVPAAPPSTYPVIDSTPGLRYDHVLAWAFVNNVNTTVSLWDLRKLPLVDRFTGLVRQERLGGAFAEAAGSFTTNALGATAVQTVNITYPAGRFTVPPVLMIEPGEGRITATIMANTTTSAVVNLGNFTPAASATPRTGFWYAVQMRSASAGG